MASKGELTRSRIVDGALSIARASGLEKVTIGGLAEQLTMSKSGIFAHFGSKEDLQLAVLEEAEARFIENVFRPSLSAARGLPRLQRFFELWLAWSGCCCSICNCVPCNCAGHTRGGCIMIASACEYDDQPGPVRDQLKAQLLRLREGLVTTVKMCQDTGELRADVDAGAIAFQLFGIVLAVHHDIRLLGRTAAVPQAVAAMHSVINNVRPLAAGIG